MIKDIQYLNQEIKREVKSSYRRLVALFHDSEITENEQKILNEASKMIGELSLKQKIVEKSLLLISDSFHPDPDKVILPVKFEHHKATLEAKNFIGLTNFNPLQTTDSGVSYCWTGVRRLTQLNLDMDRDFPVEVELILVALMHRSFSRKMKILDNGNRVRHRLKKKDGLYSCQFVLPGLEQDDETKLSILLPETLSPNDIGRGNNTDKKGIAIARLEFKRLLY